MGSKVGTMTRFRKSSGKFEKGSTLTEEEKLVRRRLTKTAWRQRNPNAWRIWYDSTKEERTIAQKFSRLKSKYGITLDQFHAMFEAQNECCKICKNVMILLPGVHVDHCHETKQIRGLLCGHCNRGIGLFKENPETLKNAIKYLERA